MSDPGWMFGAACRGVTETMFPERGENRVARRAKKICAGCPVAAECLEYALELRPSAGVWAVGVPPVDCHCGHPLVWRDGLPWCSVYGTHTAARAVNVFAGAHNPNAEFARLVIELDGLPAAQRRASRLRAVSAA
jgi:hypothetical protein